MECQSLIIHITEGASQTLTQATLPQPRQGQDFRQETLSVRPLVLHGQPMLAPSLIEQGHRSVTEHIQKSTCCVILVIVLSLSQHLGVIQRQSA